MSIVKLSVVVHAAYRAGIPYLDAVALVRDEVPRIYGQLDPEIQVSRLSELLNLVDEVYGVPPVPHRGSRA